MTVKMASTLPQGDANGLIAIARDLVDDPHRLHIAVVIVDCKRITTDLDNGDVDPTARIRRVEVVDDPDEARTVLQLAHRAYERRTGVQELPLDFGADVIDLFKTFGISLNVGPKGQTQAVNESTGEVVGERDGGSR